MCSTVCNCALVMRICFISSTVEPDNGSGRFAHSMISTLARDYGIEPLVLVCRGEKLALPNTHAVLYRNNALATFLVNPFIIAWYARGYRFMHAFDGWPWGVVTYLASCINRLPYTMSLYATYAVVPLYRPRQRLLMVRAYQRSSLNAAISHITARKIEDAKPGALVTVVLQGIAYEAYQAPREAPISRDISFVLIVGTMKQRKGYHHALPAFAKLRETHPELKLVIVASYGNDSYDNKIGAQIDELRLRDSIIRLEHLSEDQLIGLYQRAKAFFLPSVSVDSPEYFEGFGSVYLEAQACGTPVVTSAGGGQEDALKDGETGFLVKEGDTEGYVQALEHLVGDPSRRAQMSEASKRFASSMDWKHNVVPYVEVWKRHAR